MKNLKIKTAFTLAEVLVTLMIIGVIASMTIPGLKKSADERERIAQVKKAYSTIANATSLLQNNYGPIRHWNWADNAVIMDKMYIPLFNVTKNCKNNGGCFAPDYKTKSLDGTPNNEFQSGTSWYTFGTADGMLWAVAPPTIGCTKNENDYTKDACTYFEVDVNGVKKPNQVGVDIFGFIVTKEGTFPMGGCPGCSDSSCVAGTGYGWGCTARLIKEGKFSW